MGKDKFFFEEDPASGDDSGLTWEDHSNTFLNVLEGEGLIKERSQLSLEPMEAEVQMSTQKVQNSVVEIEFGTVKEDYVLHITPIHAKKNLSQKALLNLAIKTAIEILNKVIPPSFDVQIFLPRKDFEIKATSFVIKEGATTWNFPKELIESDSVPKLLEQITAICMKA